MAISASAWPTFFHLPAIVRSVHKHKLVTQGDASLTLWLLPANRTIFTVVIQSKLASPSTRQDVCIAEMNSSAVWVLSARSWEGANSSTLRKNEQEEVTTVWSAGTEQRNVPELSLLLTPGLPHKWACICISNKNVIKNQQHIKLTLKSSGMLLPLGKEENTITRYQ